MLRVEAYPVTEGMHVRVHSICTGMTHEADPCIPFGVSTVVPILRIEQFGIRVALIDAIYEALRASDELAELTLH
jgi:hypothetical protein